MFEELFENNHPVRSIIPIHRFGGTGAPFLRDAARPEPAGEPLRQHLGHDLAPGERGYLDRVPSHTAVISHGDNVVEAFSQTGWQWGGIWPGPVDYQHFSVNGRWAPCVDHAHQE